MTAPLTLFRVDGTPLWLWRVTLWSTRLQRIVSLILWSDEMCISYTEHQPSNIKLQFTFWLLFQHLPLTLKKEREVNREREEEPPWKKMKTGWMLEDRSACLTIWALGIFGYLCLFESWSLSLFTALKQSWNIPTVVAVPVVNPS